MRDAVRPLSPDQWDVLAEWSYSFNLRDFDRATQILSDYLEDRETAGAIARTIAIGNILVERLHGAGDSHRVGRLLYQIAGPAIQHWGRNIGTEIPKEEILAYLSGPNSYKPPVGQGEKMDRWVIIVVGCALALYRHDVRLDIDTALAKYVEIEKGRRKS